MPILKQIENLKVIGITFIRGYIQFLFDGPVLTMYTLPHIQTKNEIYTPLSNGYYDKLYSLIGKTIVLVNEDKIGEKIILQFEDNISMIVSLKSNDRVCSEAVMLQIEPGGKWDIW